VIGLVGALIGGLIGGTGTFLAAREQENEETARQELRTTGD